MAFMRSLAHLFLSSLMEATSLELLREKVVVIYDEDDISSLAEEVPPAIGSQYVTEEWIHTQLDKLLAIYRSEISAFNGSVDLYLSSKNESLNMPLRIYFHLVENPGGNTDFAFMATYSAIGKDGNVHHYPLRYVLHEQE